MTTEGAALAAKDIQRFWRSVQKGSGDECWPWLKNLTDGYGRFAANGASYRAHRMSLELAGRHIGEGMMADHLCRNRACVNPGHLRVVTNRINSIENSVGPTAKNAAKTVCSRGHAFTPENTRIKKGKNGTTLRECKQCQAYLCKAHRLRKRQ